MVSQDTVSTCGIPPDALLFFQAGGRETQPPILRSKPMQTATPKTYNGWANYETWNVALWIQNDESIYWAAKSDCTSYNQLVQLLWECGSKETPDGVQWNDKKIDVLEINAMMSDL